MSTVAIIQARMGSTRLPGKVMEDLAGQTMLARVVNRTKRARTLQKVAIATSRLHRDDAIADLCRWHGWDCYRGSENDLLDRYYQTAQIFHADTVVRITSDCPLIDPAVVDQVVNTFREDPKTDYASNTLPVRTFPRGLDAEVFSMKVLQRLWREDQNPETREHVTQYIYQNLDLFRIRGVTNNKDLSAWRWTVDTRDDLAFIRKIYDHFQNDEFSWQDVAQLLALHPDWPLMNAQIQQKTL